MRGDRDPIATRLGRVFGFLVTILLGLTALAAIAAVLVLAVLVVIYLARTAPGLSG